jgi:hypothetical protein
MSDVPPPTNVFEKMMAAARTPAVVAADEDGDDPVRTAVLYEARLEHADPEEPLWGVPYFGQIVRQGTAEAIFAVRKREHELKAAREDKDLGLHAVIDRFGPEAMAWRIVSSASGPRTAMRELANAEEIRLIDENGGILRDMDAKRTQTLNLTKGGQGDARAVWEAIDARRKRAYTKFQVAMAKYVEEHKSALVPREYVDEDDGYPLGGRLHDFRQGHCWKGTPWEEEAKAWAKTLPKFYWDARESDEYREGFAQRGQQRTREAFETFQAAMAKYVEEHQSALVPYEYVDEDEYTLGVRLSKFRQGQMWKGTPWEDEAKAWAQALSKFYWDARESDEYREGFAQRGQDQWKNASNEERAEWCKAMSDAQNRPDVHAAAVQRGKDQAANETAEQKADRLAKQKRTMATDASKTKRRKIATAQREKEVRTELERARLIVVPFEKSKKRRAEMYAASTDFSGHRGNAVLYMVSEDGATIRRVQKDGDMGKKYIVGPVVDPPPPDAFDSD